MPTNSRQTTSRKFRLTKFQRQQATKVLDFLKQQYGEIKTALIYQNPWQLLVATVLSAQTTDENINRVTPQLFDQYPTPRDLAKADPAEVEEIIFSTGFFRQKTKAIIGLSQQLIANHQGEVPPDFEILQHLSGVGRKTASVVLAEAFGLPAIAVDTHVSRVSQRLGLTKHSIPEKIEQDLKQLYPEPEWSGISMRFIQFGRDTCQARSPRCGECELNPICPWPNKGL